MRSLSFPALWARAGGDISVKPLFEDGCAEFLVFNAAD
jgi:hypothetical protein